MFYYDFLDFYYIVFMLVFFSFSILYFSSLDFIYLLDWSKIFFNAILPNHPPPPSPTESKRLFYTTVSLLLSHIQGCLGGEFRMGNTCTPMVDACWCMAKPIQYCKVIIIIIIIKKNHHMRNISQFKKYY